MTRRIRIAAAVAAVTALTVSLSACGGVSDQAAQVSLHALSVGDAGPTSSSTSSGPTRCGDVTASLSPPATLPSPGQMPAGSYMQRILRRGKLVAGVDQNTLLFAYLNPRTAQIEGFEIDLLHQLANAIFGNPNAIEFKAITTAQRIPLVRNGSVDIVADAFTITCQRRTQVDFSTVYYDAFQRVLVPVNSPARSIAELAHKRVCATSGSTSLARIEQLPYHIVSDPVPQRTDCLVDLEQGTADAITSDDSILLGFKMQDPYTRILGGPPIEAEPYGMAIAKSHPDFVRFVNGVLAEMRANGQWAAIYKRWLGGLRATPAPPTPHYLP